MKHYESIKVTERIYLIIARYGKHANVMQLLIGDERAAIIDTGMGATGNLRSFVEEVTDLPIDCFLTHMHPDHAGAAILFDNRYLNPADDIHCWWALKKETRLRDLQDACEDEPDLAETIAQEMIDNSGFMFTPMLAGQIFNLGGVTLEVLPAQGHTVGSVVLYCKEENAVFCGDAIAPKVGLLSEHTTEFTPITTAYEDILNIRNRTNAETKFFCGHKTEVLPASIIDEELTAYRNIVEGHASGEEFKGRIMGDTAGWKVFHEKVGLVDIIYTEGSLK